MENGFKEERRKDKRKFSHLEFTIHLRAAGSAPLNLQWYNAMQKYWDIAITRSLEEEQLILGFHHVLLKQKWK